MFAKAEQYLVQLLVSQLDIKFFRNFNFNGFTLLNKSVVLTICSDFWPYVIFLKNKKLRDSRFRA